MVSPLGDSLIQNNYLFPDEISPGLNNNFVINDLNQVVWESPQMMGEYHFSYEIIEYRNGEEISKGHGVSLIIVNETTSIQNNLSNEVPKIYPNPSSYEFNIQIENDIQYSIYNTLGRKILSGNGHHPTINVEKLIRGFYFLEIKNTDGTNITIQRITIQ